MPNFKSLIIDFVKSNRPIYKAYYYLGSLVINTIKIFVKPQNNLILFVSYGGRYYNDSPMTIYEAMIKDPRFNRYNFVWAFRKPEDHVLPQNVKKVKIDTLTYFLIALKARCWVTNVVIERALNFTGKRTFYFCTWHGALMKTFGYDCTEENAFVSLSKYHYDKICAQGKYEAKVLKSAFRLEDEQILMSGLPRNDCLANCSVEVKKSLKEKLANELNISKDKKLILYAPTYRDNTNYVQQTVPNFDYWIEKLGDDYSILFRTHPTVSKIADGIQFCNSVINVSDYRDVNDLLIISDILVSDYSSIFFDYALLEKPMYYYTYDYDDYVRDRGVYFDIRDEILGGNDEDELLNAILKTDYKVGVEIAKKLRNKYAEISGDATSICIDEIYNTIKQSL